MGKSHVKRIVRIALGSLLLILGAAGLVLPFLQGGLFLGLGVMFLAPDIKFFARMEARIIGRFPLVGRVMDRLRRLFPLLAP